MHMHYDNVIPNITNLRDSTIIRNITKRFRFCDDGVELIKYRCIDDDWSPKEDKESKRLRLRKDVLWGEYETGEGVKIGE